MQIIVTSRGMKANDILDMAYDMGFERPHIVTAGEWDGGRVHILTYGKAAYRKTLEIAAPIQPDAARRLLEQALEQPELPRAEPAFLNSPCAKCGKPITDGPKVASFNSDAIYHEACDPNTASPLPPAKPKRKVSKAAH
jgi:hypothetical protein